MAFIRMHCVCKLYWNLVKHNAQISSVLVSNWTTKQLTLSGSSSISHHPCHAQLSQDCFHSVSSRLKLHTSAANFSDAKAILPRKVDSTRTSKQYRNTGVGGMDLQFLIDKNDKISSSDSDSKMCVDGGDDREIQLVYKREKAESERQAYFSRRFTKRTLDDVQEDGVDTLTAEIGFNSSKGKGQNDKRSVIDDGDVFGTLTDEYKNRRYEGDEFLVLEDDDKKLILPRGRRHTPMWYGNQMKKLIKAGKLKEAIDILEVRMLQEDRAFPTEYNYNVLIGGCGRAGYTKQAFKLYNDMKRRGLTPSDVTYTALINACAQSPWPKTDGLSRLKKLRALLDAKSTQLNAISYRCLIKAYARCGDVLAAFYTFDEMISAGYRPVVDSFNVLLMACIEEKECGFRMALQVWHQILLHGNKPTTQTYNLLLRAVRDCGIGDVETANQLLIHSQKKKDKVKQISLGKSIKGTVDERFDGTEGKANQRKEIFTLEPVSESAIAEEDRLNQNKEVQWWQQSNNTNMVSMDTRDVALKGHSSEELLGISVPEGLPNLLDVSPAVRNVTSLSGCNSQESRLALIGGVNGVLEKMKEHNAKPDIKTSTLFLDNIPMTTKAEKELIAAMETEGIQLDVDFCNGVIRRRTKCNDLQGAKAVLRLINKNGLHPNLRTFVNLACACFRQEDGIQLLADVKTAGLSANLPLYSALIGAAKRKQDYGYLIEIMKMMKADGVKPNEIILNQLELAAAFTSNIAKGFNKKLNPRLAKIQGFRGYYTMWLKEMKVDVGEHPWTKFTSHSNKLEDYEMAC